MVSATAEPAPFSRLRHKHSQGQHPTTATEDSPAVGVGQLGGQPAAPTAQPQGTAATLLLNILYNHSHSDLHMAYSAVNPHQHLILRN